MAEPGLTSMESQSGAVRAEPFDVRTFGEFCDIIEIGDLTGHEINEGMCLRYSNLARLDFDAVGRPGISLFRARLRTLPVRLNLMERHPLGSQAFIPMDGSSFLVAVSADDRGKPEPPRATVIKPGQAVNILRNTWHAVLTPLSGSGLFAVVDWIGQEPNLVEHRFETPYVIEA